MLDLKEGSPERAFALRQFRILLDQTLDEVHLFQPQITEHEEMRERIKLKEISRIELTTEEQVYD